MDKISPSDITEIIRAGRLGEARSLLATHGAAFPETDRSALEQELKQRQDEAAAKVAQAEALELAGHIDEARAMYQTVLTLAVDYPGVQIHINRLTEALSLTKAVRRRSQRRRVVTAPGQARIGKKMRPWPWIGAGLAAALILLFLARTPSPPPPATPATPPPPTAPVELATAPPAGSSARAEGPEPTAKPQPIPSPPPPPPGHEEQAPGDRLARAESNNPLAIQTPPAAPAPPAPAQPAAPPGETVTHLPGSPPAITDGPNKTTVYRVRTGDSLIVIAQQLFCDEGAWKEIRGHNRERISDPNQLRPGMELQLDGIASRCPADR